MGEGLIGEMPKNTHVTLSVWTPEAGMKTTKFIYAFSREIAGLIFLFVGCTNSANAADCGKRDLATVTAKIPPYRREIPGQPPKQHSRLPASALQSKSLPDGAVEIGTTYYVEGTNPVPLTVAGQGVVIMKCSKDGEGCLKDCVVTLNEEEAGSDSSREALRLALCVREETDPKKKEDCKKALASGSLQNGGFKGPGDS